ncbi:MAG: (d)CMP kinase [Anaerococcus sp.]
MTDKYIIALDGPSSSGKSTLAKKLADKLEIEYLNTGSMYRAVTKYFLDKGIIEGDLIDFDNIFSKINIEFEKNKIFLNGEDVTEEIRNDKITNNVSWVSSIREVREFLVESQRQIAKDTSFILDGRDIGTVVFPNARYKFFLTASPRIRAQRRFNQGEIDKSLDEIEKDIIKRDKYDSNREVSPLKRADDAIEIDNSDLTIDQTIDLMLEKMDGKNAL